MKASFDIKSRIISNCKIRNYPLSVQTTAISIFEKFPDHNLDEILLLSCKCNDVYDKIPVDDGDLAEKLCYEFNFPCFYLKMYGFIVFLQEKELICDLMSSYEVKGIGLLININDLWIKSIENLENLLIFSEIKLSIEVAIGAIELPIDLMKSVIYADWDKVELFRNILNKK